MKKIGIVFSGGGGKGAYEIGVWKALREFNVMPKQVSGTSVGALNGALYTQQSFDEAVDIWMNIETKDILTTNSEDIVNKATSVLLNYATQCGIKIDGNINKMKLPTFLRHKGIYSQSGLKQVMDDVINGDAIRNSEIEFYACAYNVSQERPKYFHVNSYQDDEIKNILLASAAIPGVFGDVEIDGDIYWDGGLPVIGDNTPINILYENGCETIFVVTLNRTTLINPKEYPNVRILPIVPRQHLGGPFTGTLDFSNKGARSRMEHGYQDTKFILSKLKELYDNERAYYELWDSILQSEDVFVDAKDKITETEKERIGIHSAIKEFNRQMLYGDLEKFTIEEIDEPINLLTQENNQLLGEMERQEIEFKVEDYIAKNLDNSAHIQDAAMEAIGHLSSIEGTANELNEQGIIMRVINSITGKNQKLIAQNQNNLAMAQYASYSLLMKMQEKNLITLELSAAMKNRLNRAFVEIGKLGETINTQYINTYRSLSFLFMRFRKEILTNRDRIDSLEYRMDVQEWLNYIEVHNYMGVKYKNLSLPVKVVCLVNDFFRLTKGRWNVKELKALEAAMLKLNLENELISYRDFKLAFNEKKELKHRLYNDLICNKDNLKSDEVLLLIEENNMELSNKDVNPILEVEVPAKELTLELIYILKKQGYFVPENTSIDGYKKELLNKIDVLKEIAIDYDFSKSQIDEMEELKKTIRNYKLRVPVIGAFSSGKSTLLNAYLGSELLPSDSLPETAVASELHYADNGEEKLVVHYLNGNVLEYPTSERERVLKDSENIQYIEMYLNNPFLSKHKDLVLVDMPGLDSNIDAHNKAIYNYVNIGVSFILCADISLGIKESIQNFIREFSLYQSEIFMLLTKKELRDESEHASLIAANKDRIQHICRDEVFVGLVTAFDGDLNDFNKILHKIEDKKEQLLRKHFNNAINQLGENSKRQLKIMNNTENLSLNELYKKKKQLENNKNYLDELFNKEKSRVIRELQNQVADYVVQDVRSVLERNKASILSIMKSGGSVEGKVQGIVQNSFRVSVQERTRKIFTETSKKLSQYVSEQIYGVFNEMTNEISINANGTQNSTNTDIFKAITLSIGSYIVLGPIGLVIGGIIGFLNKKKKEEQMRQAVDQIVMRATENIRGTALDTLVQSGELFFQALKEKLDSTKKETDEQIQKLESQIEKNYKASEEQRNEINNAIDQVDQLKLA